MTKFPYPTSQKEEVKYLKLVGWDVSPVLTLTSEGVRHCSFLLSTEEGSLEVSFSELTEYAQEIWAGLTQAERGASSVA